MTKNQRKLWGTPPPSPTHLWAEVKAVSCLPPKIIKNLGKGCLAANTIKFLSQLEKNGFFL